MTSASTSRHIATQPIFETPAEMLKPRECWLVIGVIDSNGAVLFQKIYTDESRHQFLHEDLWPRIGKKWSFRVKNWYVEKSVLSSVDFTPEDFEAIETRMRKVLPVPAWILEGDAWNAAGRPYGNAQVTWRKKYLKSIQSQ